MTRTSGMTTMEVRKINKHHIYHYIYQEGSTSKQGIVDALHLSLSTVNQNLKMLETEGLIHKDGYYQSTGGRKASIYKISENIRIALGIGILKNSIHLVAINLYGDVIEREKIKISFSNNETYCKNLGSYVTQFIERGKWSVSQILGAGIAIQGITNKEGTAISYGPILQISGITLENLSRYIPCNCTLVHDSKAAAFAELWYQKELSDAAVLLLNHNLGSAWLKNREIYYGQNLRGGLLEHMSIQADGPPCYCGSRGCLETYCSADSLTTQAEMNLDSFFESLREQDPKCKQIWNHFLSNLAFAIRNLEVIIDIPVIISGLLAGYMIDEDFEKLGYLIASQAPFPIPQNFLLQGKHGSLAPAIGSALFYVETWLKQAEVFE